MRDPGEEDEAALEDEAREEACTARASAGTEAEAAEGNAFARAGSAVRAAATQARKDAKFLPITDSLRALVRGQRVALKEEKQAYLNAVYAREEDTAGGKRAMGTGTSGATTTGTRSTTPGARRRTTSNK